jgi:hypothetical protein
LLLALRLLYSGIIVQSFSFLASSKPKGTPCHANWWTLPNNPKYLNRLEDPQSWRALPTPNTQVKQKNNESEKNELNKA